jgi:hypothetical protein
MKQKRFELSEKDILTIIQDAQTVPLGSFMWKSGAEYDKLVKIIHSAIDYTAPRELSDEEIIEIGNAVVNLIDSNEGWIEFAKAILKKASEK